jgi:DNA integrity scanning protein DisA with diadenylate cyclase activity
LSKEIGRICRNGRTINDIEKMIADDDARREEVTQLVAQKRKALEDLHHYRTALEQCRLAQAKAPTKTTTDHNVLRILERSAELERIVSELTEYVGAKEMQLETLKQINAALEKEIHALAQAHMSKNEV